MKNLKIDESTHKRLKIFCAKNEFKINIQADVFINQSLDKLEEENEKKINNQRVHRKGNKNS